MSPMDPKTPSLRQIESRMEGLDPSSFRYRALETAKSFKRSWIELGQCLFSVYKDKLYRDWGYLTFEAYCAKEVGIRQPTAMKLLKSYSFLEREEPSFLKNDSFEERRPRQIPGYESVNALRVAKESERLSDRQYESLRDEVFDGAKEEGEIKKKIRYVLKAAAKPAVSGPENDEERRRAVLKKLLAHLESAKADLAAFDVPAKVTKQIDGLIESLSGYRAS